MNAQRDAFAHRFIAFTLDDTRAWPPALRVAFHELALSTLPELILELDAPSACRFALAWKERIESELRDPHAPFTAEDLAWLHQIAAEHSAPSTEAPASATEIARLAELLRRFGPMALSLSWRDSEIARA